MKIEMREDKHLWITFDPAKGDFREIIIDNDADDVRVCDGKQVVKIRWQKRGNTWYVRDVLVDDVFLSIVKGVHIEIGELKDYLEEQLEREPTVSELERFKDCCKRDLPQWLKDNAKYFVKNEM